MALVAECPHNKYGSSVFIRDGLKVSNISVCEEENVELITVQLPGVVVQSMYKPPPEPFRLPALGQRNKPLIVIGDFNMSQYTLGIHHNKQRRRICGAMGELKQPVTYTQRETTEIIRISYLYFQTFRICVRNRFWIPSRAHSIALYVWEEVITSTHNSRKA